MSSSADPASSAASSASSPPGVEESAEGAPAAGGLVWFWWLPMLALVVVSLATHDWPGEWAAWRLAAARVRHDDGDLPGALAALDDALRQSPASLPLLTQRSQWRLQTRELQGALDDCNAALELVDPRQELIATLQLLMHKAEVLQRQGRHEAAVQELDRYLELLDKQLGRQPGTERSRAAALNARAYFRARGNVHLEEGLRDVDQALELLGFPSGGDRGKSAVVARYLAGDPGVRAETMNTLAMMLDTRAFLLYLREDYAGARDDMELATALGERHYGATYLLLLREARSRYDRRPIERAIKLLRENMAVMYHHRGLAYEKLGYARAAIEDLERAKRLGYDPESGVW